MKKLLGEYLVILLTLLLVTSKLVAVDDVQSVQVLLNRDVEVQGKAPFETLEIARRAESKSPYLGVRLNFASPRTLTGNELSFTVSATPDMAKTAWFVRLNRLENGKARECFLAKQYGQTFSARPQTVRVHFNRGTEKEVVSLDLFFRTDGESGRQMIRVDELKLVAGEALPDVAFTDESTQYLPGRVAPHRDGCKVIYSHLSPAMSVAARELTGALAKKWQISLPEYTPAENDLGLPPGNYLLFGDGLNGSFAASLFLHRVIRGERGMGEVRVIRDFIRRGANLIYVGGSDVAGLRAAGNALLQVEREDFSTWRYLQTPAEPEPAAAVLTQRVKEVEAILGQKSGHLVVIRKIYQLAEDFSRTGYEAYAQSAIQAIRLMARDYEKAKAWTKTPPSFRTQELVLAAELLDESKSFSREDRLLLGNLLYRIAKDCMAFWEMREPIAQYRNGKSVYLTNHPLFASRSVSLAVGYLDKRFDLPPVAAEWRKIADFAFSEVARTPQGLEDSGGYQPACMRLYISYCLLSGKIGFLNENFRQYIDFLIVTSNHLGYGASYGDTQPLRSFSNWDIFQIAALTYDDSLAGHLFGKMRFPFVAAAVRRCGLDQKRPYTPRLLGLTAIPICSYLRPLHQIAPERGPVLNKASFRSGYEDDDETLIMTGINGGNHGHYDANSVVEFSRGPHFWLLDGHYLRLFQNDHNTLIVAADATLPDYRREIPFKDQAERFSDLIGAFGSADHRRGILQLGLIRYGDCDWTRSVFWKCKEGFWVFDQIKARRAADFVLRTRFRSLGEVSIDPGVVTVRQKPSADATIPYRMQLVRGDGAPVTRSVQFDHAEGGEDYYANYPYSPDRNVQIIDTLYHRKLNLGEEVLGVNFICNPDNGDQTVPQIRALGKNARILNRGKLELAALGTVDVPGLRIEADALILDEEFLTARNLKAFQIGSCSSRFPVAADFHCRWGEGQLHGVSAAEVRTLLKNAFARSENIVSEALPTPAVPRLKARKTLVLPAALHALAVAPHGIGAGLENGAIVFFGPDGEWQREVQAEAKISALIPFDDCWVYGTACADQQNQGRIVRLNGAGDTLWSFATPGGPAGQSRTGKVATLLTLRRAGATPLLVAGLDSWRFQALTPDGRLAWETPILHGATQSAVGDPDGDGTDTIAAATEYPFNYLLNAEGKKIQTFLTSHGDRSSAYDPRRREFLFGRDDGFVKAAVENERRHPWSVNVGGVPLAILPLRTGNETAIGTTGCAVVFVGERGSGKRYVRLPETVEALAEWRGALWAACRDGWVYQMTPQGKLTGKFAVPGFVPALFPVRLVAAECGLLVGFGKNISILE